MHDDNPTKPKAAQASAKKPAEAASKKTDKAHGVVRRRDASGNLDPKYAAELRALGKETNPDATENPDGFLDGMSSGDPLAEELGEHFVRTAVSGEDDAEDDEETPEERGGPFVETSARTELADDIDASNPPDATREPFPTT
jgi:hypothetical protein